MAAPIVQAGEGSWEFSAAISDDERRGDPPRRGPANIKEELAQLLAGLRRGGLGERAERRGGLGERAERNIDSFFVVADAFEANGLLMQAVDCLEDIAGVLRSLAAARAGRGEPHGLIETEDDILPYRDCHNIHVVDGNYLTGAQPTEAGYRWLRSKGVSTVINLRLPTDHDRRMVEELGMEHVHIAWPDEQPPSIEQVREMLAVVEAAPGRVFQHCLRGIGRDMTMSACYAIASHGQSPSAAIHAGCQHAPRWAADQQRDAATGQPSQFQLLHHWAGQLR
ncbi:MAG: hypothetical protein GEV00_04545 [Actinophytocola sp.]|nr:hypothetical protein [Actinophytocola sp.]